MVTSAVSVFFADIRPPALPLVYFFISWSLAIRLCYWLFDPTSGCRSAADDAYLVYSSRPVSFCIRVLISHHRFLPPYSNDSILTSPSSSPDLRGDSDSAVGLAPSVLLPLLFWARIQVLVSVRIGSANLPHLRIHMYHPSHLSSSRRPLSFCPKFCADSR